MHFCKTQWGHETLQQMYFEALTSDYVDIQGGRLQWEGSTYGVMGGTVLGGLVWFRRIKLAGGIFTTESTIAFKLEINRIQFCIQGR